MMGEQDNFSITVDTARDYVEVFLRGFLDGEVVADFDAAYRAAKAQLSADRSKHLALIDITELKIQAQNVIADFGLMLSDPAIRSARLAFVVGESPAKMQLRRLVHENTATFDTVAEAQNWLFA
jgi:hypothetical protein